MRHHHDDYHRAASSVHSKDKRARVRRYYSLFSPLPTTAVRALHFYRNKSSAFSSSTRVEWCLHTLYIPGVSIVGVLDRVARTEVGALHN